MVICCFAPVASANTTITLADPVNTGDHYLVYEMGMNGTTLISEINSSSTVVLPDGQSYLFTIKPGVNIVKNPSVLSDYLLGCLPYVISAVLILILLGGVAYMFFGWRPFGGR